ncbi:13671_t:CDS:2, partial [Gigaspora margarita]
MNNIQNNDIWIDETDSEPEVDDDKCIEVGPSSKLLSSVPKDKQITVCQIEITQDGKKKCGRKYDHTNSNSTASMNYH